MIKTSLLRNQQRMPPKILDFPLKQNYNIKPMEHINQINLKTPQTEHEYDDYSYFVYGLVKQYKPRTTFEVGLGPTANSTCAIVQAHFENSLQKNQERERELSLRSRY